MNGLRTQQQLTQFKREQTPAEKLFQERTGKAPLLQGFQWQRGPSVLNDWIQSRQKGKQ